MIRIVLQGRVRATRERWLLRGVVRVVTHPLPEWEARPAWFAAAAPGARIALPARAGLPRPPAAMRVRPPGLSTTSEY